MSFLVFLSVVLSLGICFVPVYLLRRQACVRAQDYVVSSQSTPPEVIRNSSIAYALKLTTFGPFFAWGASGDFWPAIFGAASFGLGWWLIYLLRRPMLEFLDGALSHDRSITVHEFIARQHGNDPRVRLLASSLTLFALFGLVVAEAIAVAALLKPLLLGNTASVYLSVLGILMLMVLYAILSGNSGVMQSVQVQLGMMYLGLLGSTALLLYLHVSALTPMPPQGMFAVVIVTACCVLILCYGRSKYVDTSPVRITNYNNTDNEDSSRDSLSARLLGRFEKILNPCISVFAVLVIVVALLEFYFAGLPAIGRDSVTALQTGTRMSNLGLMALILLPLFYPMVDVTNWQRIAAAEKDSDSSNIEPGRSSAPLRRLLRTCSVETPLVWLFMCVFGAIAVIATETPNGAYIMQAFMAQLASEQNEVTALVLPLLLVCVFAIALSAMSSIFSASLCTIRYDILPGFGPEPAPAAAMRRTVIAGGGLFLAIAVAFFIADASLQISFTSSTFLALLFAFFCAQLSFVPLVLGPIIGRTKGSFATVSPLWALAVLGSGAASGVGTVTVYLITGFDAWLWAAVPVCLGSGLFLFTLARLWSGKTPRAA